MGHEIPLFYGLVDRQLWEQKALTQWSDCLELLPGDAWAESGVFWRATSRNWWHLNELRELCGYVGIVGLEFLEREIALVSGSALESVVVALTCVLELLRERFGEQQFAALQPSAAVENDGSAESLVVFVKSLRHLAEAASPDQALLFVKPQP